MTWNSKLEIIRDLLKPLTDSVYHYKRQDKTAAPFIVWAEDGDDSNSFTADGHKVELCVHGSIDLYTLTEYDALVDQICSALDANQHVSWKISAVQYEDETNLIHYTFEFWVS